MAVGEIGPSLSSLNPLSTLNSEKPMSTEKQTCENPWRIDPALEGRFLPDYPDDLQVVVHDGGPRLTETPQELMWVRVTGKCGDAYIGELLNAPQGLKTAKLGGQILFMPANEKNHPFRVTEKYLEERAAWHIRPCNKCGMSELFDAPSDLIAKIFPDLPDPSEVEEMKFTSFCPMCGGLQMISDKPVDE